MTPSHGFYGPDGKFRMMQKREKGTLKKRAEREKRLKKKIVAPHAQGRMILMSPSFPERSLEGPKMENGIWIFSKRNILPLQDLKTISYTGKIINQRLLWLSLFFKCLESQITVSNLAFSSIFSRDFLWRHHWRFKSNLEWRKWTKGTRWRQRWQGAGKRWCCKGNLSFCGSVDSCNGRFYTKNELSAWGG